MRTLKITALLCSVLLAAWVFTGCHHSSHHSTPITPTTSMVAPYHAEQIATIPEHITDIAAIGNAIFLSPYLSYNSGKVYRIENGLHAENLHCGKVESVYRIWPVNEILFAGTEQPPLYLQRPWHTLQKYSSHGWAVLGNVASDGSVWRGYSYRGQPSRMWRNNTPFPSISGRIVWWVEFYNGHYYAGTSSNTSYKNINDGRIYVYNGTWQPVNTGPIGGAIVLKTHDNILFAGTCHPQQIWAYNGAWKKREYSSTDEVSKFWTDKDNHLFTATTEGHKLHVRQWVNSQWVEIWSISAIPNKWGPQGVCIGNSMVVVFRDGNITKIWKIDYK